MNVAYFVRLNLVFSCKRELFTFKYGILRWGLSNMVCRQFRKIMMRAYVMFNIQILSAVQSFMFGYLLHVHNL